MFVSVPKGDAIFLKVSKLRRYRFPVIVITQLYFHKYTNIEFKNILLVGWPWLERRTLLEIIEKLLWSASGWWKGDSCGVLSSNSTRLEPLDQTSSPLGLYHDGSHRRRQRANRRGVWVFGKKSWFQRLPSHLQRFWHLHHGILQDDLITSTFLLLLCGCLIYFLFFFIYVNRCLVVVIVEFAWSEVLNREVFFCCTICYNNKSIPCWNRVSRCLSQSFQRSKWQWPLATNLRLMYASLIRIVYLLYFPKKP